MTSLQDAGRFGAMRFGVSRSGAMDRLALAEANALAGNPPDEAAIELMLATDIVIAAGDCRFGQIEVKRGIFANHGATIRIVERAGWGNAMRYLLTGDEFDSATALRLGLVQEVVEPGQQLDRALELAEKIAAQAPLAVQATLTNARKAVLHGPEAAALEFGPVQARLFASEDAAEGVASFKEKRAAVFKGK